MSFILLSKEDKGALIEYFVANPDTSMHQLALKFGSNFHTVSRIISRDYFGYRGRYKQVLTRQSKINEPEYFLISI